MKKCAAGFLLVVAVLIFSPAQSHAWRGGGWYGGGWHGAGWHGGYYGWHGGYYPGWYGWRGGVYIGGPYWWGAYPYPYPYYGYYPPAYYAYPPPVVQGQSVYIQQQPVPPGAQPQGFWYYCESAKGYYPTVQTCPEAWIKVPPAPQ